jgi:hypothetical protein
LGIFDVPAEGQTHVVRIYADEKGNAHIDELTLSTKAGKGTRSAREVPLKGMYIREYMPNAFVDWHTVPVRQFAITILGELDVEVSGGVRRDIERGELVFLEDTHGKGHITRLRGRVTNLFLPVPDDFNVLSWARGES